MPSMTGAARARGRTQARTARASPAAPYPPGPFCARYMAVRGPCNGPYAIVSDIGDSQQIGDFTVNDTSESADPAHLLGAPKIFSRHLTQGGPEPCSDESDFVNHFWKPMAAAPCTKPTPVARTPLWHHITDIYDVFLRHPSGVAAIAIVGDRKVVTASPFAEPKAPPGLGGKSPLW